jgi:hypothetical protein
MCPARTGGARPPTNRAVRRAAWAVGLVGALVLAACDDATNVPKGTTDLGPTGGASGGTPSALDAEPGTGGTGPSGGQGGDGGSTGDSGPAGGTTGDAGPGSDDAQVTPKPDANRPPVDASVPPPDRDATVVPPDPDARVVPPIPDAHEPPPPPPDAAEPPPPADAAVPPPDPDARVTPPGSLNLVKARIVWTVGPLGVGQGVGTSTVSRNGFLRLTGRLQFATGESAP